MTDGAAPLLLHVFPSFTVGGTQVRLTTIANRLGPAFRHAVVSMDGRAEARELFAPDLDVTFPAVDVRKGDTLGNLRRFRALLRALRPALLTTSNWGSIEWAIARRGLGLRHLHGEDGFGPEERAQQIPRRVLARRFLLRGATVVLPSRTLWRIARDVWRLPESSLRFVPNGVDLSRYAAAPLGGAEAPPVVGTVAGLRSEKNVGRLIRAFALLPPSLPARLVIVGDGPERTELEALAAGLGDRIVFAGHAANPAPLYRGFDIFALSSDTEQMPLSLLEAMASALPVAATDVGDVREMLGEPNRDQVVARDDAALAGSLAVLLADAALRHRLGAANRVRAEECYAEAAMVEAWRDLYAGGAATPLDGPHSTGPFLTAEGRR